MNSYVPPPLFFNAHVETIYPSLFRKVQAQPYRRERINTPDDDFLDLDWMVQPGDHAPKKLVIISHGLEGDSQRGYVRGMARAFFNRGTDTLAWNYRGCSGETNRRPYSYHSGATNDLDTVVSHALRGRRYSEIGLVGFSLGGNLTLKYLGERGVSVPPQIKKAVTFSVPMDLYTGCVKISQPGNWIYSRRFLRSLRKKIREKAQQHTGIDVTDIGGIRTILEFDDRYTAPMNGYRDAAHYYSECSAVRCVHDIRVPTLIVNAANDPFLSPECSPTALLKNHPFVTLEMPRRGGHVGFTLFHSNGLYWSELRALEFIQP